MRVALFASPSFAAPSFHLLKQHHDLALVVSQPDKAVGRGKRFSSPPIASLAKEHQVALEQPKRLKNNQDFLQRIADLELDVAITAAYGKILPQALLDLPKHGFLNIHASLLPKYRGAAPIQWALIEGEQETGISIMQTELGLDTGPVRLVKTLPITAQDDSQSLFEKLAQLGAEALMEALEQLERGVLPLHPQDDSAATYAPMLSKDDGRVRWHEPAKHIVDRYRGVRAWPQSFTDFRGQSLKIHVLVPVVARGKPGQVLSVDQEGVVIAAGQDAIRLMTVQMPNKAKTSAYAWANGYQVKVGESLES